MNRRWLRILIAYLIAGFLGTFLPIILSQALGKGAIHIEVSGPGYVLVPLAWPALLVAATVGGWPLILLAMLYVWYLGAGWLSYWLLSWVFQKQKA